MTEDEAKKKWCPFARSYDIRGTPDMPVTVNRFGRGPDSECMCLASGCMAWRPRETNAFKHKAEAEFRKSGIRLQSDTGFCGLAGSGEE